MASCNSPTRSGVVGSMSAIPTWLLARTRRSGPSSSAACANVAGRGAAGHLRSPPWADGRGRPGHGRRDLASLPGSLHAKRPDPGPQGVLGDGRGHDPHDLRPTPRPREQVEVVATMLKPRSPTSPRCCGRPGSRSPRLPTSPSRARPRSGSPNPLERLNREVKRRTEVVGIFPNPAALHRLTACVLIEAHDEWQIADRHYLSEGSMALLNPPAPTQIGTTTGTTKEDIYTDAAVTA